MIDVQSYFDRVAYQGGTEPTLETLGALVAAHNRAIPFENLDPLLGVPVFDLSSTALADKLVRRRRGGYCYEQNGLMGSVLEALGYGAERLAARVVWMKTGDDLPARTHQVLSVDIPDVDGRMLVDVGFGGQTLTSPIRLEVGPAQSTRHEPYRLRERGDGYVLEAEVGGQWQPLYTFTTAPQPLIDLQVGSWYASTHPNSHFVTGLTAALVTDEARWNLRGRHLAIHRDGETAKTTFDTAAQVLDFLTSRFGIDITGLGRRSDVEARVSEVLDS
ncbi:arylamine N-acetyltransferase family protein [Mycobacterium sp. URHB0021]|jgi:arylamine N-acetyltransferase